MIFLRYLFVAATVWLVFLAGYLCHDVLGDWLIAAHTGTVSRQVLFISEGLFRVFLTFALVAIVAIVCVAIVFFVAAVLQEIWYQFFERKLVSIFVRQRQRREEELRRAAEDDDVDGIGAPSESVNARKHARQAREGIHNPPSEAPKGSLMGRLAELERQAQEAYEQESVEEDDDDEIQVTILGSS